MSDVTVSEAGRTGGKQRSPEKMAAVCANLATARAARRKVGDVRRGEAEWIANTYGLRPAQSMAVARAAQRSILFRDMLARDAASRAVIEAARVPPQAVGEAGAFVAGPDVETGAEGGAL